MFEDERRRYFRVNAEVILEVKEITPDDKVQGMRKLHEGETEYPDKHRLFLGLESDIHELKSGLQEKYPEVIQLVDLLNRKINLIAQGSTLNQGRSSLLDKKSEIVNLSACGLAFWGTKPFSVSQDLQFEIIFPENKNYILGFAHVAVCEEEQSIDGEPQANEPQILYRTGLDFDALRDQDLERLIAYIMRKESESLRIRKKQQTEINWHKDP